MHRWLLLLPTMLCIAGARAEPGYAPKLVEVRERPASDARVTGRLEAHAAIDVLDRQAGWLQIKGPFGTGWVALGRVRLGVAQPRTQGAAAQAQTAAQRSGIRGFSEAELLTASSNPSAAEQVKRIAPQSAHAREFAASAGLKPRRQDYFDGTDTALLVPPAGLLDE
jgi:hypothetical protein